MIIKLPAFQTPLQVRAIKDDPGFQELKEQWNTLAASAPDNVFLCHEWFSAVWAWRRMDATLWILAVFSSDELVGILPLLRCGKFLKSGRQLAFLTVPDTQWCDLLVESNVKAAVCDALADHLSSEASGWDSLCLECLRLHSHVETSLLPALKAKNLAWQLDVTGENLFVDLRGNWKDYYASRSRSVKKACNLATNRLSRAGILELERLRSGETEGRHMKNYFEEAVLVSRNSWKHAIGKSLEMPGPHAFLFKLAELTGTDSWLAVWILRLNRQPVATELQVVSGGNIYALRSDFDKFHRTLSPGTYLNREIIEEMFAQGFERYYMGPGQNVYKKNWSTAGEPVHRLIVYGPTMRGQAKRLWLGLKSRLRSFRNHIRSK